MWKRRKFVFCLIVLHLWLIDAASGKADICASLCRCVNESHFVKIHCDFIDDKVSHKAVIASPLTHTYAHKLRQKETEKRYREGK